MHLGSMHLGSLESAQEDSVARGVRFIFRIRSTKKIGALSTYIIE